jgi:hypothetical protein
VEDAEFSARFLMSEWEDVADAWQHKSWEAYRPSLLPQDRLDLLENGPQHGSPGLRQAGLAAQSFGIKGLIKSFPGYGLMFCTSKGK